MPLNSRLQGWVDASYTTAQMDGPLIDIIQGLGYLDIKLLVTDAYLIKHGKDMSSDGELMQIKEHLTMSYLWVLGAYEAIRTICQRTKGRSEFESLERFAKFEATKKAFNRIRIPLAKLEVASGFKDLDCHIVNPVLNQSLGTGWQVNASTFIIRSDLSDQLLASLEHSRSIDKSNGAS